MQAASNRLLQATAERVMREHGFSLEIPADVSQQLKHETPQSAATEDTGVRDLRTLPWSSIDNETSRDLDQLEVVEQEADGAIKVMVAIADVDAFVPKDTPIDRFAAAQTTTVYTGVHNFPMIPDALSTGVTSLLAGGDKLTVVIEFRVSESGRLRSSAVYRGLVRNTAQLTYGEVGEWLEGRAAAPRAVADFPALASQLRLQDRVARMLRNERHRHGALNIDTIETRPVVRGEQVVSLETQPKNCATALIEDFMIASNEIVAGLLEAHHISYIKRVVKSPARWDRIVTVAARVGGRLPSQPDSKALNDFLQAQAAADPDHFPDLSLAIIKLMGPGEYVLETADADGDGHFGLAVDDYTHSTAPNRRFADLVTQRLLKAVLAGLRSPYSDDELGAIAATCTARAAAARKVEREMSKFIAAVVMRDRIGDRFEAIVTGVTPRGTFVRTLDPHVEGLLMHPVAGLDVGDKLTVTLANTDVDRGFVDFAPA
jgi:VacB/RNase II family 3'-5' exoribonuclease